jgi:hypothetical protein
MSYYDTVKTELTELIKNFKESRTAFDSQLRNLDAEKKALENTKKIIEQMAKERQIGFPVLARAYDDLFALQDKQIIDFLRYKDKPALSASEIVKKHSQLRREALREKRVYEYLVDYYESVCPFLVDLKEEVTDITEEDRLILAEYDNEELEDETTLFLTKEEYRKLSTAERNQLALDRYWKRPKSKWHIGKLYERYVGYLYEAEGYEVEYAGIFKGLEDLGRDVIATKGKEIVVVQCKNWSKFRTIYEKHIFQFFGTVFQYKDENRDKNVQAVFYSTTKLSDLARRFAQELDIGLKEEFKMNNSYPCIKCNVSRIDGTKIYHLPFDQMYDKVKIELNKGEFYCASVAEAERAGFRRAYRHRLSSK